MAVPSGDPSSQLPRWKSPISILKELGAKRRETPMYEQLESSTASDQPMPAHPKSFTFKVVFGEYSAIGTGTSKKKARHACAQEVLAMIEPNVTENLNHHEINASTSFGAAVIFDNPVGQLEWMRKKRWLPPPVYQFTCTPGPPHMRQYTCTAQLDERTTTGSGRSHKVAKREAALSLLLLLQQEVQIHEDFNGAGPHDLGVNCRLTDHVTKNEEVNGSISHVKANSSHPACNNDHNDDNTPANHKIYPSFNMHIDAIKTSSLSLSPHGSGVCSSSQLPAGLPRQTALREIWGKLVEDCRQISERNLAALRPVNYCESLQALLDARYLDIEEKSLMGHKQCLVQLNTAPIIVCRGVGRSEEQSRSNAASTALAYLQIFSEFSHDNTHAE